MDYLPYHILFFLRDPPKRSFQVLLLHLQSEQCSHSDDKNQYHNYSKYETEQIYFKFYRYKNLPLLSLLGPLLAEASFSWYSACGRNNSEKRPLIC